MRCRFFAVAMRHAQVDVRKRHACSCGSELVPHVQPGRSQNPVMPMATRCEPTHRQRSLLHHARDLLARDAHATIAGSGSSGCTDLWQLLVAARLTHAPPARDPAVLTYAGVPEDVDCEAEGHLPRRHMGLTRALPQVPPRMLSLRNAAASKRALWLPLQQNRRRRCRARSASRVPRSSTVTARRTRSCIA